tara:strand:- start:1379 stop:2779 length:1401 start_codon:yes stop_codon:yes gene_type:complete
MKKFPFTLPFKSNFFKEQDPFHLVIVFFIIFFGTAIFFSIPTFYDFKKYNEKIENTINSEYKFKLHNLENVSFRFIPSPHLLIKKADLKINANEDSVVSNLKNIKVFISITDFYKNDIFAIKRIEVKKGNFYLNANSFKNIIQNLKKNIVNNLIIEKSTIFFKNKKEEIVLISTIRNLNYKIDFINSKKILKINGNIFDANYQFTYMIDYNFPNIQNTVLELRDPNITLENKLEEINFNRNNSNGDLTIRFLNKKNILEYKIKDNLINFNNKNLKNPVFDLNGSVNFEPFHFDLILDLKRIKLKELENILYNIYKNQDLMFENLSGKFQINFSNIDNKILNSGFLNLKFENSKLFTEDKKFNLDDFASLEISDYEYLQNNDQVLQMKIKVNIEDNEKFNRFLFNFKKDKIKEDKIYFTYQYNNNTGTSFISQISNNGFGNNTEFYKFNNVQQLKILLRDDNIFNLD